MQERRPLLVAIDQGTDPGEMNAPDALERQKAQIQRLADAVLEREGVKDDKRRARLATMGIDVGEDGDE